MIRQTRPLLFGLGFLAVLLGAAGMVIVVLALASNSGSGWRNRYGETKGND